MSARTREVDHLKGAKGAGTLSMALLDSSVASWLDLRTSKRLLLGNSSFERETKTLDFETFWQLTNILDQLSDCT